MYSASNAFHNAVANGAHQIALLIFNDAVFTNDDIDVSAGIQFNDYFNTEDDLTIGTALSNEISFSLFNDERLLNDYEFGDFTATIGAQIGNETVTAQGTLQAQSDNHTYVAYSTSPYLKRDGVAVSSQPARAVKSMLIYDGTVYCLLVNGAVIGYKDSTGATKSVSVNDFMLRQMTKWDGKGISYSNRILRIWKGTNKRTYEFVPLGVFTAERPNVPDVIQIQFTCYDLMQKFDKDMPSAEELGLTYPTTFSNLFIKLCSYAGVQYGSTYFINSTASIDEEPEEFKNATMREVLQWLAEAAGSVARINRDGRLVMDWLHNTSTVIDEHGYKEFNPYWYETKSVSKLYNRGSDGSYENTVGSGDEGYLIQDNPLLRGVT